MTYALAFLAAWGLWTALPFLYLATKSVPWRTKGAAYGTFVSAALRGLLVLPVSLTAPIVVPIALLFTRWEDDKLPSFFWMWDNEVGINGDRFVWLPDEFGVGHPQPMPLEDTPEVRALCYYAKGHHPRSFYARYIWMGWRNRGAKVSEALGVTATESDREFWGDNTIGRDKAGWTLYRNGSNYQYCSITRLGPICVRINYGFKVWGKFDKPRAMVVNVSFSLISWTGT